MKKIICKFLALIIAITTANFCELTEVKALQVPDFIIYEGRLLDSADQPITTAYMFRFSLWKSNDFNSAVDLNATGGIDTTAPNYGQWQEQQVVTPNSKGIFSVQLGKTTPFTGIDFSLHKYLQVEIKAVADPATAYQLMDPTGDNGTDANDRKAVGSLPYALNAESAYKSNQEVFVIDADDTIETAGVGAIQLQFGNSLGKILSYDFTNSYFDFNDSVNIQGDLTLTGLINGVNIALVHTQNTDTGTSSPTFEINSAGNKLVIDTAGLTDDRIVTFNDADTVVVGEDNVQTLTNKTIDGDQNTLVNIDRSALKNQNKTIILSPDYQNITIYQDGTDNKASIYGGNDGDQQYYFLSSQESTLQDLDLKIVVPVPDDFVAWQSSAVVGQSDPLGMVIKTTTIDPSITQVDVVVNDSLGNPATLTGGSDLAGFNVDIWERKNIAFTGTPTFTPGESFLLTIKMQAKDNKKVYVGEIKLNYIGK